MSMTAPADPTMVAVGNTVQCSSTDPSPITWTVINGPGTVDSNGLYTAPSSVTAADGSGNKGCDVAIVQSQGSGCPPPAPSTVHILVVSGTPKIEHTNSGSGTTEMVYEPKVVPTNDHHHNGPIDGETPQGRLEG